VVVATNSWATYTGSLEGADTLFGTGSWSTGTLDWNVSVDGSDIWTYDYTFTVESKDISHLIFEVSTTFDDSNIYAGTTEGYELAEYSGSSKSNPGLPGSVYGLKWDLDVDTTSASVTIVSDRAPMWGDFYAKGGVERIKGVKTRLFAYNTKLEVTPLRRPVTATPGGGRWYPIPIPVPLCPNLPPCSSSALV